MSAKLLLAVMQTYAPTYLEEMLSPLLDRMLESPSMSYEVRKKVLQRKCHCVVLPIMAVVDATLA